MSIDTNYVRQRAWWPGGIPWTANDAAADELAKLDIEMSWGQQELLALATNRGEDDKLLCGELFVRGERQSGKTTGVQRLMLWHLLFSPNHRIVYTAPDQLTAEATFRRMMKQIEALETDHILRRTHYRSHGSSEIEGVNGARSMFIARDAVGGVRGFTADILIFDGAEDLDETDLDEALPTLAAIPDSQVIFVGVDFSKGALANRTKLSEIDPPSPSASLPASYEERKAAGLARTGEVDMGQLDTPLTRQMRSQFPEAFR